MAKKQNTIKKVVENKQEIQDTVVFMTAYNIHKFKQHFPCFWRHGKTKDLIKKYHILGISNKNVYVSPDEKCSYTVEYDSLKQVSAFNFEESIIEINERDPHFLEEMMTTLSLHHSSHALLDSSQIDVSMCFNMESFLVMFDTKVIQVDPVAFLMNGSLIVNFELIDFESEVPFEHDAIYGRSNNYGIQSISKIKYFNESEFAEDNRKISDIIFQNIFDFINKIGKGKWEVDNFSFVHNTFVMSSKITDVGDYFQKVLGAQINNFDVNNISATSAFNYYSTEYLGVVTQVTNNDINNILFDCMMLESFKVYLLLKMIIDYEVNHKLNKIIDNQIYVESLFYPAHVPIITLNVISNLKETVSFSRYKQAINFKIEALKIYQERKRTNNGRLMNVLLYILTLLGSAQTLQVLQTEIGLPFKNAFWIVISIFVVFGAVWFYREFKKQ